MQKWDMGIAGLEVLDHDIQTKDNLIAEKIVAEYLGHEFSYEMVMDESTESVTGDDFQSEDPWFDEPENRPQVERMLDAILERFK